MDIKDKSVIETEIRMTTRGTYKSQKIKFVNKKGTFMVREQCQTCVLLGKAIVGLGRVIDITCDRDKTTWRRRNGRTQKDCKFYQGASKDGDE